MTALVHDITALITASSRRGLPLLPVAGPGASLVCLAGPFMGHELALLVAAELGGEAAETRAVQQAVASGRMGATVLGVRGVPLTVWTVDGVGFGRLAGQGSVSSTDAVGVIAERQRATAGEGAIPQELAQRQAASVAPPMREFAQVLAAGQPALTYDHPAGLGVVVPAGLLSARRLITDIASAVPALEVAAKHLLGQGLSNGQQVTLRDASGAGSLVISPTDALGLQRCVRLAAAGALTSAPVRQVLTESRSARAGTALMRRDFSPLSPTRPRHLAAAAQQSSTSGTAAPGGLIAGSWAHRVR